MSERDELADILMSDAVMHADGFGRDYALAEADAIIAAGYRKPQMVTTAEELDDAIRRSFEEGECLVLMTGTRPWIIWEDDGGLAHVSSAPYEDDPKRLTLDHITLPATVIHDPSTP